MPHVQYSLVNEDDFWEPITALSAFLSAHFARIVSSGGRGHCVYRVIVTSAIPPDDRLENICMCPYRKRAPAAIAKNN